MKEMKRKMGFTLVEIMIVVAIIGLLAAIGIPSFQKARENARSKACINNLRIIDGAKQQYAMDNNIAQTTEPTAGNLNEYIKGDFTNLVCPAGGGTYTINAIATNPACPNVATYSDHVLAGQ